MNESDIVPVGNLVVGEIYPFTRASAREPQQQPAIYLKDKASGKEYLLCGTKVLWSLLDIIMDGYYRKIVRDHIFNGPTDEFRDRLQDSLVTAPEQDLILNLCSADRFYEAYGQHPMANTRHQASSEYHIVECVTSMMQDGTLNHLKATMQDVGIVMQHSNVTPDTRANYNRAGLRRRSRSLYSFVKSIDAYTVHLNIAISDGSVIVIEPWVQGEGFQVSPVKSTIIMRELDPRYLGPTLKRIYDSLCLTAREMEGKEEVARSVWDRICDKWVEWCRIHGERTTPSRTKIMAWRHKNYRLSGGAQ